jgi:hypothetical protein
MRDKRRSSALLAVEAPARGQHRLARHVGEVLVWEDAGGTSSCREATPSFSYTFAGLAARRVPVGILDHVTRGNPQRSARCSRSSASRHPGLTAHRRKRQRGSNMSTETTSKIASPEHNRTVARRRIDAFNARDDAAEAAARTAN